MPTSGFAASLRICNILSKKWFWRKRYTKNEKTGGHERIDETIDPELTIDRVLETYLKRWIL
jgi:hypothetical protein